MNKILSSVEQMLKQYLRAITNRCYEKDRNNMK
jgi:hypothetical protein